MCSRSLKRVLDVSLAAVGLILFALPMVLIALAIRLTMGSPVFFHQVRPGKDKRPFTVHKFRTMNEARGMDGSLLCDGARLTRLGTCLRRASLDELPQLWNVLVGDMSLVGPRPLLSEYLPHYTHRECLRFAVRPGITGWAQVQGRNLTSWNERLALDVWYVENGSFLLDCRILFATLTAVLRQKGAMADPRSVMPDLNEERAVASRREPSDAAVSPC